MEHLEPTIKCWVYQRKTCNLAALILWISTVFQLMIPTAAHSCVKCSGLFHTSLRLTLFAKIANVMTDWLNSWVTRCHVPDPFPPCRIGSGYVRIGCSLVYRARPISRLLEVGVGASAYCLHNFQWAREMGLAMWG